MACNSDESLLHRFLDGELLPDRAAAVKVHLDDCGDCRDAVQRLRQVSALVAASVPLPSGLWRRIERATTADSHRPEERLRVLLPRLAAACLGAVLFFGTALLLEGALQSPAESAPKPAETRPVPAGDPVAIVLLEALRPLAPEPSWIQTEDILRPLPEEEVLASLARKEK